MKACGALCALLGLMRLSQVRSICADVDLYFGSMTSGTNEIDLGQTTRLACPKDEDTEIIIASGQDVIVNSGIDFQEPVQFKNIRFTVEEGASLAFSNFVRFGPNNQDIFTHAFRVNEGASVTFLGKFRASKIPSAFLNFGSIEFKTKSFFNNNSQVFSLNAGTIKFRGSSKFINNDFHGIENSSTGFVRFSKKATFIANGATFDDTSGCGLENNGGTVVFRGDTIFQDHKCREAAALYNDGTMRFYGKAIFNDNVNSDVEGPGSGLGQGGGLRSWNGGDLIFKGDVEFNRNTGDVGGGMGVVGGDITFREAVSFTDNEATMNGGGFAVINEGSVTFTKPDLVTASGNNAASDCSFGYVSEGGTLVGLDDVCDE